MYHRGSVLGPLLCSLYKNDLPLFLNALWELFADDTTIHSSDLNLKKMSLSLQEKTNNLLQWTELNHMSLNWYKTKYMTITIRQKRQNISSRMIQTHKLFKRMLFIRTRHSHSCFRLLYLLACHFIFEMKTLTK